MDRTERFPEETEVVVVGGGLAGLAAAAVLARQGRSVVVLEQSSRLGGRAATQVRDGIHFNLGPHALYCHGHAFRLLRELGVSFTGHVPNTGQPLLFEGERPHRLPTGLGSVLASRLMTLREKGRLIGLLARLGRLDTSRFDGVALAAWLESEFGRGGLARLLRVFFRVSTYCDDAERLSAGAALAQLKLALTGNVWYLDDGWQTLVDGLRDCAVAHGAMVHTGAAAQHVEASEAGVCVRLTGDRVVRAGAAILAVGPNEAAELLDLAATEPLARWAAGRIPVRAACLDVALRRLPRPGQRVAFGLDRPLYASVHSAAARLAPEGVAVVHVLKYLGAGSDDRSGPADVEAELESFLERLQPGWRAEVVDRRYLPGMTVAHALPRADAGGHAGRPGVAVAGAPGVFVAGDWVGPQGWLADGVAASAEGSAQAVLAFLEGRHELRARRAPLGSAATSTS
jgi:phytoene dehydrogenase-like protein